MKTIGVLFFVATLLTAASLRAAPNNPDRKSVSIDSDNTIRISYYFPEWNTDPKTADTASIMMREPSTGRLVQIHLVETEANSSTFAGLFKIKWQDIQQYKVEFYRPAQSLLETNEGIKKIAAMIASKEISPNPFILRRAKTGLQTVEIFDNRNQAAMTLVSYNAEVQLQGLENQRFPPDNAVDTATVTDKMKFEEDARKIEVERLKLEQVEAAKLAKLLADEGAAGPVERQQRKAQAQNIASQAMALYKSEKSIEATIEFDKAVALDPENRSFYFQYGVALYRADQFTKSIVYLGLADGPGVNPVERDFFIGLDYFRLKNLNKAVDLFNSVAASKDPEMAPPATFYKGVMNFEDKKWEDAKAAFQSVLDTTKDPQLDQRADQYIQQILRQQQFEAERARKWQIAATIGEQYDSNVNLNATSALSQGSVTNADGFRSLFMESTQYRPIYEEDQEFAVQLNFLTMYTTNTSFNYNQTLRNADPTVVTALAPWSYKGVQFGKGYRLDLTPGLEEIGMSIEDNTQKMILYSYIFNISNLFIMSDKLYSNFNIELRQDINQLQSVIGINDTSAFKIKLINSNLHFISADKTKIITSEIDATLNNAAGLNATYNRFDLAFGYIAPFVMGMNATAKLGYFYLDYPTNTSGRTDNSYTLTLGSSKKLSDRYSTGLVGTYNINQSNVDVFSYSKWTAMLTFSALLVF